MAHYPAFTFDYDTSVAEFAVSKRSYLNAHPDAPFSLIATKALVIDTRPSSSPRILLLQRAADDSNPHKWEPPGGACDDDDQSILHAAARELWEEASLHVARIGGLVGDPHFFSLRDGRKICEFHFAVYLKLDGEALPAVKLDPKEHQNFVWATESEVKEKKVNGMDLQFTSEEIERTVLLAFDHFKGKGVQEYA